jgi:hypothetical protein
MAVEVAVVMTQITNTKRQFGLHPPGLFFIDRALRFREVLAFRFFDRQKMFFAAIRFVKPQET